MENQSATLGRTIRLQGDLEAAVARVGECLKTEGFGILTEIDVKETFKNKLNIEFRPYRILGACNPQLAYRALSIAPEVGMLLPCNVTVSQTDNNGVEVSILDPFAMMGMVQNPALETIAAEAREKLDRVAIMLGED